MNKQQILSWVLISSLMILLSGCGFQLKGYRQAAPQLDGLFVEQAEKRDSLAGVVRRELQFMGTKLAPSAAEARYRLRISRAQSDRRVNAVDSNGKVLGYELRLRAAFLVLAPDGTEVLPEQQLELLNQLTFSGDDELGQLNQIELMRVDMRQDMADQIIRRLQAQLK